MISHRQKGMKNVLRTSIIRGNGTALAKKRGRSRRKLGNSNQSGLESLCSMIVNGELGIYRLMSMPEKQ